MQQFLEDQPKTNLLLSSKNLIDTLIFNEKQVVHQTIYIDFYNCYSKFMLKNIRIVT